MASATPITPSPSRATPDSDARKLAMLLSACAGPVREALEADDVIEIMANPDGQIFIEKVGVGLVVASAGMDAAARERIIRLVASSIGEPCDRLSPIVSAELPGGGERFEGLMPPVAQAPCFSIRKPSATPFSLDDYVAQGALTLAQCEALRAAASERLNILVAGGTSSGKTTFTNALLAEAALADDRIVILEDTRELRCAAPDVVALRTHRDHVTLKQLVRSTLRLRPDRIIVGEVRGAEALDLLKAWNTGHPGGITTLHANSARGALSRLEQLVGEATPALPFGLIGEAIDVVVFLSRASGRRRVEEVLRVSGFCEDGYALAPLFPPSLTLVP
ncbi:MAG: P-type conjugative transfer ATPase TrbB [Hirschia sp.]|nr:P-type conjugative transfer ATPase TrbB [Hirschia sp.]MBF16901.1 P-type conjugative transfer ATPase TrbB [Hirschia sp.]